MSESRRPFYCGQYCSCVAVILAAVMLSAVVAVDVADLAGAQPAGGNQAPAAQQLLDLNTGFAKLLLKYNHTGTLEGIDLDSIDSSAQGTHVATAGAWLNNLVKELNRQVAENIAERMHNGRSSYSEEEHEDEEEEERHHSHYWADDEAEHRYQYHRHHPEYQQPHPPSYQHRYADAAPRDHYTAEHEIHGHDGYHSEYRSDRRRRYTYAGAGPDEPEHRPYYDAAHNFYKELYKKSAPYERHASRAIQRGIDSTPSPTNQPHSGSDMPSRTDKDHNSEVLKKLPRSSSATNSKKPARTVMCLREASRSNCMADETSHPLAADTVSYT